MRSLVKTRLLIFCLNGTWFLFFSTEDDILPRRNIQYVDYTKSKDILVNHPSHYQSDSGIEVIDVIEAFTKDLRGIEATDTGNVIKYICRWYNKNGLQDLEKAQWYLTHLIEHVREREEILVKGVVYGNDKC